MATSNSLPVSLERLVARGDTVGVENGRLVITSASGRPVPSEWLARHERALIVQAARAISVEALEYLSYSVGNYGPSKSGGVSLQFRNLIDLSERYAIFNAQTRRNRNTTHGKKGAPLPSGQFRVTERFKFYGFWLSTGIAVPRRLSAFHDYMGKLASQVFTGTTTDGKRLDRIYPLSISHTELERAMRGYLPDNSRSSTRQFPDTCRTTEPDKESPKGLHPRDLEAITCTGPKKHGNTVTRGSGYTDPPLPPQEQTNNEWLAAYERAG